MPRRISLKAYTYTELGTESKGEALAQLEHFGVARPLDILEALFTESGCYLTPEILATAA